MLKRRQLNKKRQGSVLVFVLILFLILSIISTSVAFVFSSNLKMSTTQQENMRAHYLALSGVDITISTLLSIVEVDSNGDEITLHEKIRHGGVDRELNDQIFIEGETVDIKLNYDSKSEEFTIESNVTTKNDYKKELSLNIIFSGNQHRTKWN